MKEYKINFAGYTERCQGFTIPNNMTFYIVSFEDLVYYDLKTGKVEVQDEDDWDFEGHKNLIYLKDKEIPFIGLWGGKPLLLKEGIGRLSVENSLITLRRENGEEQQWQFENFSGDWEKVTFDMKVNGFLFGAPYDIDFRYIVLD